jgi:hypothetical protein
MRPNQRAPRNVSACRMSAASGGDGSASGSAGFGVLKTWSPSATTAAEASGQARAISSAERDGTVGSAAPVDGHDGAGDVAAEFEDVVVLRFVDLLLEPGTADVEVLPGAGGRRAETPVGEKDTSIPLGEGTGGARRGHGEDAVGEWLATVAERAGGGEQAGDAAPRVSDEDDGETDGRVREIACGGGLGNALKIEHLPIPGISFEQIGALEGLDAFTHAAVAEIEPVDDGPGASHGATEDGDEAVVLVALEAMCEEDDGLWRLRGMIDGSADRFVVAALE